MHIDITHIPFSRYGAYIAVTREAGRDGAAAARQLIVQSARRRFDEGPVYALTFGEDGEEDFICSASPEAVTVKNEHGTARLYIRDDDTLVLDSEGLAVRLRQLAYGYRYCEMSCRKAKGNYENFDALTGKGLRAPGYTWSASVYMLLQDELQKRRI